jgi:hypothetical protein
VPCVAFVLVFSAGVHLKPGTLAYPFRQGAFLKPPEEYKQKKAELINRKFDISEKGDSNGDWLEQFKNFLTLAHQASYIAAEANPDAQRDFLQKIVSNLKLYNKTLIVSYSSDFKFMAENRHLDMGSLYPIDRKHFRP